MPISSTGRAGACGDLHGRASCSARSSRPAARAPARAAPPPARLPARVTTGSPAAAGRRDAAAGASWSGRRPAVSGSVSRNWAPEPGWPQTCSQPPCSRASSRLIESPSPLPPTVRTREGSARQNRSNTCCASAELRPTPRSRTVTAAAVGLAARVISTGRPAPCSMALPTRLRRIRSTRRASTSAMTFSSGRLTTSSTSCRPARAYMPPTTRSTSAPRSVASESRTAAPASYRLISRRSVSRPSKRSSSAAAARPSGPRAARSHPAPRAAPRRPSAPWSAASAARGRRRR